MGGLRGYDNNKETIKKEELKFESVEEAVGYARFIEAQDNLIKKAKAKRK